MKTEIILNWPYKYLNAPHAFCLLRDAQGVEVSLPKQCYEYLQSPLGSAEFGVAWAVAVRRKESGEKKSVGWMVREQTVVFGRAD